MVHNIDLKKATKKVTVLKSMMIWLCCASNHDMPNRYD